MFQAATISYPPAVIITVATNSIAWSATGSYQRLKDVELRNTSTTRITSATGSNAQAKIETGRDEGWRSSGTGNQLINCVVHDHVNGIVSQTVGGTIVRGSITYNNGMNASDGGAGHGIYVHNKEADLRSSFSDVVTFNNYGLQMQYYNQDPKTSTGNMTFDRMVSMNGRFGILGQGPKNDITVSNTHVYNGSLKFGYAGEVNGTGSMIRNYVYGQQPDIKIWAGFTFPGNKIVGRASNSGRTVAFLA